MTGGLLGWAILTLLTCFATLDALALAARARTAGRAELALVATAAWFALITAPVLVLGYANALTPGTLVPASLGLSSAAFLAVLRGRTVRDVLRTSSNALAAIVSIPRDALREAARARSIVFVGLAFSGAILVASYFLTVFAPNENWDGFLYHEPIVGFAIQNHGFAIVPLPMHQAVQATNGYPHLCEAAMYWLVAFTDKTLIELPNGIGAPAMMLALYVLARRFGDRVTAMGWACVLFLMPQAWSQLCQTLIDMVVAFFVLFAIHFATRPQLRISDALWAILGMALVLGSKSSGLVVVPPIALLLGLRLVRIQGRARRGTTIAVVSGGAALLVAIGSVVPLRNWLAFQDPLWPVSFASRVLGIRWDGLITIKELGTDKPLPELIQQAYDVPIGGMGDVILRGYGYAIPYLVFPLGILAGVLGLLAAGLEALRWRERSSAGNLGLVLLLVLAGIFTTPTLNAQSARYNTHLVAGLMVAITWVLSGSRWVRAREGVVAAALALSIVPLFWMRGRGWFWASTEHPEDVLRHPFASRTELERPSFDLLAIKRNAELGPGDWAAFDQDVAFVGALWNFEFSNRVKLVKYESTSQFALALEQPPVKWVAVGKSSDSRKALERSSGWELVGEINSDGDVVFRRKPGSGVTSGRN
jgi:hypothetical protein